ncbi:MULTISPECIES: MoaD/ThiS family protein [Desulfosediminicola]|uniref:MoaD/ThiS family protein n=1 Tax=Desulfosediminicola TaxID=2886823 RepID=UPI00142EF645|nr:MoaD/ThiS family protein [Desulfosediminicola ganghwensis]
MIQVDVCLISILQNNRFHEKTLSLEEPANIQSLLALIEIKDHEVEGIYVNRRSSTFEQELADGDRVTFMPAIGGG